jgi:hypothetical protein
MKLPAFVWSQLGRIPVEMKPLAAPTPQDLPDFGGWDPGPRSIEVNSNHCDASQLATLFHEMTHVALWDSGAHNVMTSDQQEVICDAIGAYFACAVQNGYVKLQVPKD